MIKKLLLLIFLLPALANACDGTEKIVQKMIERKEVTMTCAKNEVTISCDIKKVGKHRCDHVFEYYRKIRRDLVACK